MMTVVLSVLMLLVGGIISLIIGWLCDVIPTYLKAHWQNPEVMWQPFLWPFHLPIFNTCQWLITGISALVSMWLFLRYGLTWTFLGVLILSYFLLTLAVIDWHHQLLPDCLTLPLLWLGLFFNIFHAVTVISFAVLGAMAGYLFLWFLYYCYYFVTDKKALGGGDMKLFAAIGAWVGWPLLPMTLLIAALLGIAVYLLWRQQGKSVHTGIPFGTCLAIGGWLSLIYGPVLLYTYGYLL